MQNLKRIVLFFFLLAFSQAEATVWWASKVISYSSQYSSKQLSSSQVLGKPNVIPGFGVTPCAWRPLFGGEFTNEWIEVAFTEQPYITRVAVSENNVGGGIGEILFSDSSGKYYKIYSAAGEFKRPKGSMLNISINRTPYRVRSVKLILNYTDPGYKYQIDAIAVSDEDSAIAAEINTGGNTGFASAPENLGSNVNSRFSELLPVISPRGDVLYFARSNHPENTGDGRKVDVWYSAIDSGGKFGKAVNIGPPINNNYHNFLFSVTQDGNSLILGNRYMRDGTMAKGASVSYRTTGGWSFPDSITIRNFINLNNNVMYFLASSGKELLLSIETRDSRGGLDLYVSRLLADGTWSEPENLGDDINTAADEATPFLAPDCTTLYFSTSGRCGYGDNDIFIARRKNGSWKSWEEPKNIGSQVNTPGWDGYFTIPASGDWAYFSSSTNSIGMEDLFRIKLPKDLKPKSVALVKGRVLNIKTGKLVDARISYEILPSGEEAGIARPDPITGEYSIVLPAGSKYGFLAQADGFIPVNENLDLRALGEYGEVQRDLILVPIEVGQVIRLNNIFFEFGKYELLEDSYSELNRVDRLLAEHPRMRIEIDGHTDDVGTSQANQVLSLNRAKAVSDYLLSKGIAKKRLIVKGYGQTKPLAPNDTEENRQKNRRVEFRIVEE